MSDERLRELERRWKETGANEDGAGFLLECVRTGALTPSGLELLAYCEDGAAQIATEGVPAPSALKDWLGGLLRFGKLGSLAACILAFAATEADEGVQSKRSQAAREVGLAWVSCPCREHAAEVQRILDQELEVEDLEHSNLAALWVVRHATRRLRRRCVEQAGTVVSVASRGLNPRIPHDDLRKLGLEAVRTWLWGTIKS